MAFKPNYRQQRSERSRTKDEKKKEKLQRLLDKTAQRKAGTEDDLPVPDEEAGIE